jgi:hypothetical protein
MRQPQTLDERGGTLKCCQAHPTHVTTEPRGLLQVYRGYFLTRGLMLRFRGEGSMMCWEDWA